MTFRGLGTNPDFKSEENLEHNITQKNPDKITKIKRENSKGRERN